MLRAKIDNELTRAFKGELLCSVVRRCRRPRYSNVFSSDSAGPIKAKLHEGEIKVYINGPGHIDIDIEDIDIETLFNVEYDEHYNISPVGLLFRQTCVK